MTGSARSGPRPRRGPDLPVQHHDLPAETPLLGRIATPFVRRSGSWWVRSVSVATPPPHPPPPHAARRRRAARGAGPRAARRRRRGRQARRCRPRRRGRWPAAAAAAPRRLAAVPPRRAHCRPGRGCRFSGPNSSTQRPPPGRRARRRLAVGDRVQVLYRASGRVIRTADAFQVFTPERTRPPRAAVLAGPRGKPTTRRQEVGQRPGPPDALIGGRRTAPAGHLVSARDLAALAATQPPERGADAALECASRAGIRKSLGGVVARCDTSVGPGHLPGGEKPVQLSGVGHRDVQPAPPPVRPAGASPGSTVLPGTTRLPPAARVTSIRRAWAFGEAGMVTCRTPSA